MVGGGGIFCHSFEAFFFIAVTCDGEKNALERERKMNMEAIEIQ